MNFFKSIIISPTKSSYKGLFKKRVSRYELLENVTYITFVWGIQDSITIPKGYKFDGASVPSLLWTLVWNPFETDILGRALIHDYLYEIDTNKGKKFADDVFFEAMTYSWVNSIKRGLYYLAVHLFWKWEFKKNNIFLTKENE